MAPVIGILIRLSLEPVGPHDYWWHLAMGRLIAATGEIPTQNLFLYTLEGDAPFVDQPWLGQWVMYALYEAFGHAGPIVLRNTLAAVAWAGAVGIALLRCRDPRIVGGLALLTAVVSGPVFGVRTQMFAFVPYVVLVGVLFAVATQRLRRPWLLALAPLTALWANLHGTFMLVPVLVGLMGGSLVVERWLEERQVEWAQVGWWAGAGVAVSAAAMFNPLGPKIFVYVWELTFVSHVSETVTEWQPPSVDNPMGVVVLLTLTGSLIVLMLRRKHVRLFEAVLFAATAYLAVSAVRQMFWWGAVMLVVVPRHLSALLDLEPWWKDETSTLQGVAHALAAFVLVAAGAASQPGLWVHQLGSELRAGVARRTPPAKGLLKVDSPTRLVSQLGEHGYPKPLFHDQGSGGYLGFALGTDPPGQVAFVDQRMELIPEDVWDDYFKLSRVEVGWQEVIERYEIRSMLLSPREQWRLVQAVQADPRWTLVGLDEAHLLFLRSDATEHITRWRSVPSGTAASSR